MEELGRNSIGKEGSEVRTWALVQHLPWEWYKLGIFFSGICTVQTMFRCPLLIEGCSNFTNLSGDYK